MVRVKCESSTAAPEYSFPMFDKAAAARALPASATATAAARDGLRGVEGVETPSRCSQ